MGIEAGVSLAGFSSWQVGGTADHFALPASLDELKKAIEFARAGSLPLSVLGGGTNVLISDKGIRGLTICLKKLTGLTVAENSDRLVLECWSGTSKAELLRTFLKYKLEPALFLGGLPGDVGGGVVMNAGVGEKIKPREFVELVDWVEVLRPDSLKVDRIEGQALKWTYRHCSGWQPGIIVRVGMSWPLVANNEILGAVRAANLLRAQKQPLELPSCGSVFVNPEGSFAGQLIEQCGLKGYTVGGAKISEKHANFIVNFKNAKAAHIHAIISHVRATVKKQTGVELRTEVVYMGDWPKG
jgi:UDP-N-acetylmuramate dehydrogenase